MHRALGGDTVIGKGLFGAIAEILAMARDRYPSTEASEAVEAIEAKLVAYFTRLHPNFDAAGFHRAAWSSRECSGFDRKEARL
jgi:hypothetical protein